MARFESSVSQDGTRPRSEASRARRLPIIDARRRRRRGLSACREALRAWGGLQLTGAGAGPKDGACRGASGRGRRPAFGNGHWPRRRLRPAQRRRASRLVYVPPPFFWLLPTAHTTRALSAPNPPASTRPRSSPRLAAPRPSDLARSSIEPHGCGSGCHP